MSTTVNRLVLIPHVHIGPIGGLEWLIVGTCLWSGCLSVVGDTEFDRFACVCWVA